MHGLILAGGEGSRLAADGLATPKALVDIAGVPQLLRQIDQLAALGCTSITCMLNDTVLESLRNSTDPSTAAVLGRMETAACIVPCHTPSSLHTFVAGLERLPAGDVFATMVDSVMSPGDWRAVYDGARRALSGGAAAALAVTPARDDDAPLWVATDADSRVVAIGARAASPGGRVTGGVYAFAPVARSRAVEVLSSGRHRMRNFLDVLVASGADVRAIDVEHIIDVDHRTDLERANEYMTGLTSTSIVSERP